MQDSNSSEMDPTLGFDPQSSGVGITRIVSLDVFKNSRCGRNKRLFNPTVVGEVIYASVDEGQILG